MAVSNQYYQSDIGLIPSEWQCEALENLVDLLTGFPFPSKGYSRSGMRLLRGANVKRGVTDWADELTVYWPNLTVELQRYLLKEGDVVIAMDGSLVGRSFASLSASDVPALLLQRVARLRSSVVLSEYLAAWVCSRKFTEHCDKVKTTTAIPHISPADIRSFKIAVPPARTEQQAIATALSDADAYIESLEQLITKKRQIKQGVMQELVSGKRRLPGFEGEWKVMPLGDVVQITKGTMITESAATPGDVPVVAGGKQPAYFHNQANRFGKTITISASGVYAGYVALYKSPIFASDCSTISEATGYCIEFVFYQLSLKQHEIYNTQTGGAQPHVHGSDLRPLNLKWPPLPEQKEIARLISDMEMEIGSLELKMAKARHLKQAMMQQLLTGKIRLV